MPVARGCTDFRPALRDVLPLAVPIISVGTVFGIVAREAGISTGEAMLMSALVFAGASQFLALILLENGASLVQIVLATLAINSRHLVMGASLAPHFRRSGLPARLTAAGLLTDESYVLSANYFARHGTSTGYYVCAGALIYLLWLASTFLGITWARALPDISRWGLDFAFLGAFIGLLGLQVRGRTAAVALLVSAAIALAGKVLVGGQWYISAGALGGVLAGWLVDSRGS